VLVSNGRSVVGIVTDRDLALRVVAAGRDPRKTQLVEIMSSPVATLDVGAPHSDALRLMRELRGRRIPLLEGKRIVGLVTLDDLLLEGTATLEELGELVRAQIVTSGPARTRRFDEWTALARSHARALGTKAKLLGRIRRSAALASEQDAATVLDAVLDAIVRGVEPDDAEQVIARLPVALRARLRELPPGPHATSSRESAEQRIAEELEVGRTRAAEIASAVGASLSEVIPASSRVGRRLPSDLRLLLRARRKRRTAPRQRVRREDHSIRT
jgi:uncharacterized protein (DUF2267 family)